MEVINNCNSMSIERIMALSRYANRLEAEKMEIHPDGSITLSCKYGGICEKYMPTDDELYKK